jgi:hypothetical protein
MLVDLINEYRKNNGKEHIFAWDPVENDYCLTHCYYMAWNSRFEHTPEYFLKGKAEAIALCYFQYNNETTMRHLVYEVIDKSKEHKDIVLNYENLAYGFYIYNNKSFLTIRGWNG